MKIKRKRKTKRWLLSEHSLKKKSKFKGRLKSGNSKSVRERKTRKLK